MNVNTDLNPVSNLNATTTTPVKDKQPAQDSQQQPTSSDTVEISRTAKELAATSAGAAAYQSESAKDQAAQRTGKTAQEEAHESPGVEAKEEQGKAK